MSVAAATDLVARFLANACPDHHVRGGPEHTVARYTAARLLERHPDLGRASLSTAVVCGDVREVQRLLRDRPELAKQKTGPLGSAGGQSGDFIQRVHEAADPLWEP